MKQPFLLVNKLVHKLLLSGLIVVAIGHTTSISHAQEPSATDGASLPVAEVTVTTPSVAEQLRAARDEYRQQLEKYRQLERQYTVDTEQNKRLQTLTALESAVTTTRETTISRSDVLASYLTLLQLLLQNASGLQSSTQEQYLQEIDIRLDELSRFRNVALSALDRPMVEAMNEQFLPMGARIEATAYQVQTLLVIGKLQTVYNQAVLLTDELSQLSDQQSNELIKAQQQRAIQEIRDTLSRSNVELDQVIRTIAANEDREFSRSNYTNFTRQLNTVYAQLTQALGFLAELTAGTSYE